MTIVRAAFRCTQPDLITTYKEQRAELLAEFQAKIDSFQKTVGGRDLHGDSRFDGVFIPEGYYLMSESEDPVLGWKRLARSNFAFPDLDTPEGEAVAKTLDDLFYQDSVPPVRKFPGCPEDLETDYFVTFPVVEVIDGVYYLLLSFNVKPGELEKIDPTIWEPVSLPQYRAILSEENY